MCLVTRRGWSTCFACIAGEHYGFISRQQRDKVLKLAAIRFVMWQGWLNYRKYELTRHNLWFKQWNLSTGFPLFRWNWSGYHFRKKNVRHFTVFKKNNECYLYWVNYLIIRSCNEKKRIAYLYAFFMAFDRMLCTEIAEWNQKSVT